MKKIVLCMLLLLPLIILASVMLAVDVISVEAYIPVEEVVLNKEYVEVALGDKYYEGLVATVFPTSAKDKDITWSLTDVIKTVPSYEGEPVTIDKNGKINFYSYCTFKVVATAAGKSAACTFYVKGDNVESVVINSAVETMQIGESEMLSAVFYPVDAIVKNVTWSSSNNSVLKVDNNGIVTAKAGGRANISVKVKDTSIEATKTIVVNGGVSPYGTRFFATNGFDISNIENPTIINGGYIDGGRLYFDSGCDTVNIKSNNRSIVVDKCDENDIIIENSRFFVDGFKLKVGKLPLTLTAIYAKADRNDKPDVSWTSSDENIASINNEGFVQANNSGNVTFTAKDNLTNRISEITIKVVKPVSLIVLNMPQNDVGIAAERIFGNRNIVNGNYEQAYLDINFVIPTSANINDFVYTSSNDALAYFESNRLYFSDKINKKEKITITVYAKEKPYESVDVFSCYDIIVENGINCNSYEEMEKAIRDQKKVCLQNNINADANAQELEIKNDIYGNGYKVDAKEYLEGKGEETILFKVASSNVTLSNIAISMDEPTNISQPNGCHGMGLLVGEENQAGRYENIRVEYSTFENAFYAIRMNNSDLTIDGCIVRNISNFGISLPSTRKDDGTCNYSNLSINNIIITNVVAPAIGISADDPNLEEQSTFNSTGFLDIYNWQDITSAKMLDRTIIKDNEGMNDFVKSLLKNVLKNEFAKSTYDNVRYSVINGNQKTDYLHLGIIQAGAIYESTTEVNIEDENFSHFELDVIKKFGIELPVTLYCYDINSEITPESSFVENKELYRMLREGR